MKTPIIIFLNFLRFQIRVCLCSELPHRAFKHDELFCSNLYAVFCSERNKFSWCTISEIRLSPMDGALYFKFYILLLLWCDVFRPATLKTLTVVITMRIKLNLLIYTLLPSMFCYCVLFNILYTRNFSDLMLPECPEPSYYPGRYRPILCQQKRSTFNTKLPFLRKTADAKSHKNCSCIWAYYNRLC